MNINKNLNSAIQEKKHVFGTWCMLPSDFTIDVISKTGIDFVVIDMEHGTMNWETAERMVRSAECNNTFPIIRVTDDSEQTILHALETNVKAILVPHVSSLKQAEKVASSAKYKPLGNRGLSPYTRCHNYDHQDLSSSLDAANSDTFLGILVEGIEGLNNLSQICKVENLDMIYLGIYDIAQSLNLAGDISNPKCIKALKESLDIIHASKKFAGTFTRSIEDAKYLKRIGFEFIAYLADSNALYSFYNEAVKNFND
tara:strand:- start:19380 stop:20147 length:768 start_codon:yes stop_codon:yes gene_type:complete